DESETSPRPDFEHAAHNEAQADQKERPRSGQERGQDGQASHEEDQDAAHPTFAQQPAAFGDAQTFVGAASHWHTLTTREPVGCGYGRADRVATRWQPGRPGRSAPDRRGDGPGPHPPPGPRQTAREKKW